jgi:uncharacterized protein (DUF58 family)
VTRAASPKLGFYALLAGAGLVSALAFGRPEPAVVAVPLLLFLVIGLGLARDPELTVDARLRSDRVLEGEEAALDVTVESATPVDELELLVALPRGVRDVSPGAAGVRLDGGESHVLERRLRTNRWGGYRLGDVILRARDPLHLLVWELYVPARERLRVYPREERLRQLVRPSRTQLGSGNQVSRAKGDGLEFADLRPFMPGDRPRRVHWRASARRGELWVTELHPERNADVVLFLDTFAEARRHDTGTLDLAVRAAATLSRGYLAQRDRVGIVGFGGVLRWLLPGTGAQHGFRIAEALIDTDIALSYAWKGLDVIPPRTIPPGALVLALSPLLDQRTVGALGELAGRGFDLCVVEVSAVPFEQMPRGELGVSLGRLRVLEREKVRLEYQRLGISVVEWVEGRPLAVPIEEVRRSRRFARRALG